MPKISVGRDDEDFEKHGLKGTGVIGKHLVGENEEAHTANTIHFDLARPHVMGIFGKRGTGKCLLPDEKVLTERGLEPIKTIFDRARRNGEIKLKNEREELYNFEGPEVQAITEGFKVKKENTVAAYRKKVEEKLYRLKTASGREITVTGEHPLLTSSGWKEAETIDETEKIGIPRAVDAEFKDRKLKVPENFSEAEFSNIKRRESKLLAEESGKISELSDGSGSYRRMVNKAEDKGLIQISGKQVKTTETGKKIVKQRKSNDHFRLGKSKPINIPEKVTPELCEFTALLIAEGHEQKINENNFRIMFTNKNEDLRNRFKELGKILFDLEFSDMDDMTVYTNSKALEELLEFNGYKTGNNSFKKTVPNFVLTASDESVRAFLRAFFDCEGNLNRKQIELSTASRDIASAVSYMLMRFGIITRITQKEKYAANTEEKKVRTYHSLKISGKDQVERFKQHIGFSIEYKSDLIEKYDVEENTNVDTVRCGDIIESCRKAIGADRNQVAEHKQSLNSYEDGDYHPSRQKLGDIVDKLESHLQKLKLGKKSVQDNPDIELIEKFVDESGILWKDINEELGYSRTDRKFLEYSKFQDDARKLAEPVLDIFDRKHDLEEAEEKLETLKDLSDSDVFWDRVEKVTKVDYEGWVYDITVENNHSFTAGFGGLICHNSYSMGTIAEELQSADVSNNLSTIMIDPMGIYWSMKRPNDRAAAMLEQWDLEPDMFEAKVYIPAGKVKDFEKREMPYDETFTLNPGELSSTEWAMSFKLDMTSDAGILLERVIGKLTERKDEDYDIDDIMSVINSFDFPKQVKNRLENSFMNAKDWGIFGEESSLDQFTTRGELSIIDVSVFGEMAGGWSVRSLVVGILAKRLLRQRMTARRVEEIDEMEGLNQNEMPITWMLIDEAHEFLPSDGKTAASHPLMRWVKIGREPGVSLVLATQQPAKLHPDALSQCDVILSHRLTSKQDIDSLGEIMHTYMRHDINHYIDALPDAKGTGLLLDDNSERIYPVQMRPRKSWHAGGTPDAFED